MMIEFSFLGELSL